MVEMQLGRLVTHLLFPARWQVQKTFPPAVRSAIQDAIRTAETTHCGQIRFAVEGVLHPRQLWGNWTAQERALQVFSELRIWDTEHNNGVLIYLLLADHSVAIIADRGIHAKVGEPIWRDIAKSMEECFAAGDFQRGSLLGIQLIREQLELHFPASDSGPNELPDEVVLL
jgi:uncharacterized membrane protein